MAARLRLSVVVPVYGCSACLSTLHARIRAALDALDRNAELILVDDGSPDGSWDVLRALSASDPRVRSIRLSRNFGQHAAITAGLAAASGDWVVVMDCDLEDRPEEIPRLLERAFQGFEIVLTRRARSRQSLPRRLAARTYLRVRRRVIGLDVEADHCTLSVLSRKVVDAFLTVRDVDRQYMLIVHWLGFRRTVVEVEQGERPEGQSAYNLSRLAQVAFDGFFFESTTLLRWVVYLGFLVAFAGTVLSVVLLFVFFFADPPSGYTSLAVLLLLIGGFIIASTGVTGLYIGKVFAQVKQRPLYMIEEDTGSAGDGSP